MIKHIRKTNYGMEGVLYVPFFDTEIGVIFPDDETFEYAKKCADYLCHLPESLIQRLGEYSLRYCEECREWYGEDEIKVLKGVTARTIMDYITPSVLIVDKPENEQIVGFHIELNCCWEEEHGMEWTIKNDKIRYVGSFDGMSAWADERLEYVGYYNKNESMNLNYADKE